MTRWGLALCVACVALFGALYADAQSVPGAPVVVSGSGLTTSTANGLYCRLIGCAMTGPVTNTTAGAALTLGSNATATPDSAVFGLTIDNDASARIRLFRHSTDVFSPLINLEKSRGTHAAPVTVSSSDQLGGILFNGYDSATFAVGPQILAATSQAWTNAAHGSSLEFDTYQNNNANGAGQNRWQLGQDGSTTAPGAFTFTGTLGTSTYDGVQSYYTNGSTTATIPVTGVMGPDGQGFMQIRGSTSSDGSGPFLKNSTIFGGQGTVRIVAAQNAAGFTGPIQFWTGTGTLSATGKKFEITDNGGFGGYEQNEPIPTDASPPTSLIYVDNTQHGWKLQNNGDAYDAVARQSNARMVTPVTNNSATLSSAMIDILVIGNYQCKGQLILTESVAADGAKCALTMLSGSLAAGSAGAVSLQSTTANTGDAGIDSGASMAPSVSLSVFPSGVCTVDATLLVTGNGNVGFQYAQASHSTGTLTANGGSIQCMRL